MIQSSDEGWVAVGRAMKSYKRIQRSDLRQSTT
jgi:hypothetical protein